MNKNKEETIDLNGIGKTEITNSFCDSAHTIDTIDCFTSLGESKVGKLIYQSMFCAIWCLLFNKVVNR